WHSTTEPFHCSPRSILRILTLNFARMIISYSDRSARSRSISPAESGDAGSPPKRGNLRRQPMPRYIFSIRGNDWLERGDVATLPDLGAAREAAIRSARRTIDDLHLDGHDVRQMQFEIANCAGEILLRVPFRDALDHR